MRVRLTSRCNQAREVIRSAGDAKWLPADRRLPGRSARTAAPPRITAARPRLSRMARPLGRVRC